MQYQDMIKAEFFEPAAHGMYRVVEGYQVYFSDVDASAQYSLPIMFIKGNEAMGKLLVFSGNPTGEHIENTYPYPLDHDLALSVYQTTTKLVGEF